MSRPLRVAVIGSGPSGMYAADALLGQSETPVSVDIIDKLPTPFGLVRYGVAPDHLSIRSVRDTLDKVLDHPGVRFLGNVEVGVDITLQQLREFYDAIVLTYGASRDRLLGIPGEHLAGSVAATDFVNWYTGHPDTAPEAFVDFLSSTTRVAVIGVGNVAVDVTRVLSKSPSEIEHTDMPEHVFAALRESGVRDVHVIGRRGPAQATWTTKELRELGDLEAAQVLIAEGDGVDDPASQRAIAEDKAVARNVTVVGGWRERADDGRDRRIHLHFRCRPVEILGDERVEGLVVEVTELDEAGQARGSGVTHVIPVDGVIRSVGYRGTALAGVPFDDRRNVIPNDQGRVVEDGARVPGLYVAGWIKRGPTGIIGTNKKDAVQTVACLLEDLADPATWAATKPQPEAIDTALAQRAVVGTEGWRRIDAAEQALGATRGRDRTTLHERTALLTAASD
jgi:ferredoxin--NADP+ reductase